MLCELILHGVNVVVLKVRDVWKVDGREGARLFDSSEENKILDGKWNKGF